MHWAQDSLASLLDSLYSSSYALPLPGTFFVRGDGAHRHPWGTNLATGLFSSRRKRNAGWMQQTDEFNYDSAEEEQFTAPVASLRYAEGGKGYSGGANDGYADPFDPEKLPESVHRQQMPMPNPSGSSREPSDSIPNAFRALTDHPRNATGYTADDITPKHSPTSPTFEGGTKFKEQF